MQQVVLHIKDSNVLRSCLKSLKKLFSIFDFDPII